MEAAELAVTGTRPVLAEGTRAGGERPLLVLHVEQILHPGAGGLAGDGAVPQRPPVEGPDAVRVVRIARHAGLPIEEVGQHPGDHVVIHLDDLHRSEAIPVVDPVADLYVSDVFRVFRRRLLVVAHPDGELDRLAGGGAVGGMRDAPYPRRDVGSRQVRAPGAEALLREDAGRPRDDAATEGRRGNRALLIEDEVVEGLIDRHGRRTGAVRETPEGDVAPERRQPDLIDDRPLTGYRVQGAPEGDRLATVGADVERRVKLALPLDLVVVAEDDDRVLRGDRGHPCGESPGPVLGGALIGITERQPVREVEALLVRGSPQGKRLLGGVVDLDHVRRAAADIDGRHPEKLVLTVIVAVLGPVVREHLVDEDRRPFLGQTA